MTLSMFDNDDFRDENQQQEAGKGKNKGEWSEAYAFLRILGTGKLTYAHSERKSASQANPVLKIVGKAGSSDEIAYLLSNALSPDYASEGVVKIRQGSGAVSLEIPAREFDAMADILLTNIKRGSTSGKGSFRVPEVESFLRKIKFKGSPSGEKKDLHLRIHDFVSQRHHEVTFSIKSYLGADPSLFNASGTNTNLRYQIDGPFTETDAVLVGAMQNFKDKFEYISQLGAKPVFNAFVSPRFEANLNLIDSDLKKILPAMVLLKYRGEGSKLQELTQKVTHLDPLGNNKVGSSSFNYYEVKVKKMLVDMATGMTADTEWTGTSLVWGGMIVVDQTGEILSQHMHNINEFRDYLYRTSRFDTPSTKRAGNKKPYPFGKGFAIDLGVLIRISFPKHSLTDG